MERNEATAKAKTPTYSVIPFYRKVNEYFKKVSASVRKTTGQTSREVIGCCSLAEDTENSKCYFCAAC